MEYLTIIVMSFGIGNISGIFLSLLIYRSAKDDTIIKIINENESNLTNERLKMFDRIKKDLLQQFENRSLARSLIRSLTRRKD